MPNSNQQDLKMQAEAGRKSVLYSRFESNGRVHAVNPAMLRDLGLAAGDLGDTTVERLCDSAMPATLRALLRERLEAGDPCAAYLRKRTRAGEDMWMFAILVPFRGDRVCVSLPAASNSFADIPDIYGKIIDDEAADPDPSPRVIANRMLALAHDFSSHEAFVSQALSAEFAAFDRAQGEVTDPRARILSSMNDMLETAMQERDSLTRNFGALQLIPNNMRIVASRLEPAGGPISAIAENYKSSWTAISQRLQQFLTGRDSLCEMVSREAVRMLLLLGAARLLGDILAQDQVTKSGQQMPETGIAAWEYERDLIEELSIFVNQQARAAMTRAVDYLEKLGRASSDIRRHLLGLDTIRVLGRVECSRMQDSNGLAATLDQLDAYHSEIRTRLGAIIRLSGSVGNAMAEYLRIEQREQAALSCAAQAGQAGGRVSGLSVPL